MHTKTHKLEPCPKCISSRTRTCGGMRTCNTCGYSENEILWNRRPIEHELSAKLAEAKRDLRMMCDFVEAGQITAAHVLAAKLMGHKANDTGGK